MTYLGVSTVRSGRNLNRDCSGLLDCHTYCFSVSYIFPLQEVRFIKQALFPVLMCHAAGRGDIDAMEDLRQQVYI